MDKIYNYRGWRQRIPLSEHLVTPGYIELDWDELHVPDVQGKSFLEVGSNDGFLSFEAEKLGAKEVYATDVYRSQKEVDETQFGCPIEGIQLAKEQLNSNVHITPVSVYDLDQLERQFDIVLMSNVIAWLRDPITCIERLSEVTGETLIIRDGFIRRRSNMHILRYDVSDPWIYRPNLTYMETLLRENGFTKIVRNPIPAKPLSERYNAPWCTLDGTPAFYAFYTGEETLEYDTLPDHFLAIEEKNDRVLIRRFGWVEKSAVRMIVPSTGILSKSIQTVFGRSNYDKFKTAVYDFRNDVAAYSLVATR